MAYLIDNIGNTAACIVSIGFLLTLAIIFMRAAIKEGRNRKV
jgi:hypothetical protein